MMSPGWQSSSRQIAYLNDHDNPYGYERGGEMAIIINIDVMMARRKISLGELAERVEITPANLSILKNGKAKAIRFSTLEAICRELVSLWRME